MQIAVRFAVMLGVQVVQRRVRRVVQLGCRTEGPSGRDRRCPRPARSSTGGALFEVGGRRGVQSAQAITPTVADAATSSRSCS
jgi:hypothetical protein